MKRYLCLLALLAGGGAWAQESAPALANETEAPLSTPTATPVDASAVTPVQVPEAPPTGAPSAAEPPAAAPPPTPAAPVASSAATAPPQPQPQPQPLVPAGRWEGDFSAALSLAEGSTKSLTVQLGLDASYERPDDKLSVSGQYLESRARSENHGVLTTSLTALQWRLGGRYDNNFTPRDFGFVGLDFSHDEVRQLLLRSEPSVGLGRHLWKERDDQWDVYAGLSYREDLYYEPVEVDGQLRTRYETLDTLFGQESSHQLTQQVRFKQKFVLYPGLLSTRSTRALFDAGLLVDINKSLSLSVKLQARYDGGAPSEKLDLLLLTGLSVKFRD